MLGAGLKVILITCSILLKSLSKRSGESEVACVIALVDDSEESTDEVLLSSTVEACTRNVVEALGFNRLGEETLQLVQEQPRCKDRESMINTVVDSTVLKGVAVLKCIEKVVTFLDWPVYTCFYSTSECLIKCEFS